MSLIEDFFRDIDRRWALPRAEKIRLRIIGSTALMLRVDYERITKDRDVIETTLVTALGRFRYEVTRIWKHWLGRRGGQGGVTWASHGRR